jgi:hypothetical protein
MPLRHQLLILWAVAALCAGTSAWAQTEAPARRLNPVVDPATVLCLRSPAKCPHFKNTLSFPAHALSRSSFGTFSVHTRGVNWNGNNGAMSFTMRRPAGFNGNRLRLRFFYEMTDDSGGDLQLLVTAVSLKHGSGFETYGSVGTVSGPVPESPTILQESSLIISPGQGWSPTGDWWYFEIGRQGSFQGGLRLMSVAVEY